MCRQLKRALGFACALTLLLMLAVQPISVQWATAQTTWGIIVDNSLNQGGVNGDVSIIQSGTDMVKGDITVTNTKLLWWKVYVSTVGEVDIDTSNLFIDENETYFLLAPKGSSTGDALPTLPPTVTFHQLGSAVYFYADRTTASGFEALSLQVAEIALIALTGGGVPTSMVELILDTLQAPPFIEAALALGEDPPDLFGVVEAISEIASDTVALQQLRYILTQLEVPMTIEQIMDAFSILRIFQELAIMYDLFTSPYADNVAFKAVEAENEPLIAVIDCNTTSGTAPLPVHFNASDSYSPQYPIELYQWDFGDGETATAVAPTHTYSQAGKYHAILTVTDTHGRQSTANRTLVVYEQRIQVTGAPEIFHLTFEAQPSPMVLAYLWHFGDGSTAEGRIAEHTYEGAGEYTVILTLGLDPSDPTQDWVPWVAWDTINITMKEDTSPAGWHFSVDKYDDAPDSVAVNGIIVEDANEIWTNSLEHSVALDDAAEVVDPRIVVEYADSMCDFSLQESQTLNAVTSSVSPRIVVEYADSMCEFGLQESEALDEVAATVSPRIIVEYAATVFPTDLQYAALPYDIAITNLTSSKRMIGQGYPISINLTVQNQGEYTETFNVTAYANTTIIGTLANLTLTSGQSTTVTVPWNTTGVVKGNYTIRANVTQVPGEIDTADNTYVDDWVVVTIPGDIDGDYDVDYKDLFVLAKAYGSKIGDPSYVPEADINDDGKVDYKDLFVLARHYG